MINSAEKDEPDKKGATREKAMGLILGRTMP